VTEVPLFVSVIVMVAPGIAAPVLSTTEPKIVPKTAWAKLTVERNTAKAETMTRLPHLVRCISIASLKTLPEA
jgi:hypothetical protein